MAAADVRETKVLERFADLHRLANYVIDRMTDLGTPLARGQSIKVPAIGNLTVHSDGATRVDGASRQQASTSSLELSVNQEPWIPIQIPKRDDIQSLQGNFMCQVGEQALIQLRNYVDGIILDDYLATEVAFDNTGTYHRNPDAGSLDEKDFLYLRGKALRQKSSMLSNLAWIADPLAMAAVMQFTGWRTVESNTVLGAETVGRLYGIPVIESQGVRRASTWTEAAGTLTAAAISSSVLTLTFSANTGLVPGQLITTTGLSDGNVTDEAILSVNSTGTQITCATTGSDTGDALGGSTVVTETGAQSHLIDTAHVYKAMQLMPDTRIVPDPETTGDILQVSTLLGYIARAGRVWTVHSPDDAI